MINPSFKSPVDVKPGFFNSSILLGIDPQLLFCFVFFRGAVKRESEILRVSVLFNVYENLDKLEHCIVQFIQV